MERADVGVEVQGWPAHIEGHVVSRGTYERYGCRCKGCTADKKKAYEKFKAGRKKRDGYRSRARNKDHGVEVLLAQGLSISEIMKRCDVPYSEVKLILDRMK